MVLDYIYSVVNFVTEHRQKLSQHETEIWKEKARVTVQSVVDCLGYVPSDPYGGLDDFIAESAIQVPMNSEELLEKDAAVDSSREEDSGFSQHVEAFKKTKEENVVPQVQEIFDAVKSQEFLLENLPSVPIEASDDENSFDKNIEERFLRLKFFRQTWCSKLSDQTEPQKAPTVLDEEHSEPKRKFPSSPIISQDNVCSTNEERDDFNNWYLEKIG